VGSPNTKTEEARDERIALVKTLRITPPHVLVGTMGRIVDLAEVGREGGREGGRA
jgi:superfamily II DNA/RNA helicase